jgi:hypothetical protein
MSIRWRRCLFRAWVVFAVLLIAVGAWLSFKDGTPVPLVFFALSTLLFPAWIWLSGAVIFWTIRWMWRDPERIVAWLRKPQGTKEETGGVPDTPPSEAPTPASPGHRQEPC